jgi:hypothetical protein
MAHGHLCMKAATLAGCRTAFIGENARVRD